MVHLTSFELSIVISLHKKTWDMPLDKASKIVSNCLAEYKKAIRNLDTYGIVEGLCNLNYRYRTNKENLL